MMTFAQEIKFADTVETYVVNIAAPVSLTLNKKSLHGSNY